MASLTFDTDLVPRTYFVGFEAGDTIGPEGLGPIDFTLPPFCRREADKLEKRTWAISIKDKVSKPKVRMLAGVPPKSIIMYGSGSLLFIRQEFADSHTELLHGSLMDERKVSCVFESGEFDYTFCNLSVASNEALKLDWSRSRFLVVRHTNYTNGRTRKESGQVVTFTGRETQFHDFEAWRKARIVDLFDFFLPIQLCYPHAIPEIIKPFQIVTLFSARLRAAIEAVPNPGITFLDHEVTVLTPA